MNLSIIRRILGYVLLLEAGLLLLPWVVSLYYQEEQGSAYIIVAAICLVCGGLLAIKKPRNTVFYLKEGCVATALSWIALSLFGCVPFMLTGEIPSFIDALFETVSGFSTTGASILDDVEAMSRCSLFWRSFTHWIGGMGVLVFIMAVVPLSGGSNINLLRAESPGPSVSKLAPKMKETARFLYIFYFAMTIAMILFLLAGKMPFFDAVVTAFGTAGTGGFGIKNDSIASYSSYVKWVIIIFMTLFGVNFNAYFYAVHRQFKKAFSIEEIRWYFGVILVAFGLIFYDLKTMHDSTFKAVTDAAFQVSSVITTTGFSTDNFDAWPQLAKTVILGLMFIGACAGSTGGGMKISRFMVVFKNLLREIHYYIHPKSVKKVKIDGKPISQEIIRTTNIYFITIIFIFCFSLLLLSFEGNDFTTNFSAVLTALNNVGPGFAKVGPTGNFAFFNPLSKLVLIVDMLTGRLELYPILILLNPTIWKDTFTQTGNGIKRKLSK